MPMTKTSKWTLEEENYMRFLKEEQNIISWKTITAKINERFPENSKQIKQCRERYNNYTKYGTKNQSLLNWSQQEEEIMVSKCLELGPSWKSIQQILVIRSENNIKNKFYSGLRKFIRNFNLLSPTYQIKFETIKRMLKATDPSPKNQERCLDKYSNLRVQILKNSQLQHQPLELATILDIKAMLKEFNTEMRALFLGKRNNRQNANSYTYKKKSKKTKRRNKIKAVQQEAPLQQKVQLKEEEQDEKQEQVEIQVKNEEKLQEAVQRMEPKQINTLKKEEEELNQDRNFMAIPLFTQEHPFPNFYMPYYPHPMAYNYFLPPGF